ncbi:MFS transporter [Sinomonas sp. ASV486]|uniref:MFS transporter n=1 Tax=Sinomonas sp. ASV486 TaxID=3051170 RepID=UPI0027DB8DD4|nr:MFS transporter [Sinomonas sp. ASV486]MDQ4489209.1 MFS transporter [Sinomonas sp. ASV486]
MTAGPTSAASAVAAHAPGQHARKAAMASFAGSTLEYYDFFIYGSASALIFNKIFFPGIDPLLGQFLSMATLGIGYVVRPFAAGFIGHFGDRIGRKQMLVFTLVSMGLATFLIGCLPPTAAIGAAAPILLVLLRVVQGISAAGESVGAVTLSLEHAPSGRRAFFASWVNTGAAAGIMLASLAFLLVSLMPQADLVAWGWRLPFLASIGVAVAGFVIRRRLPEAELFEEARGAEKSHELPLKVVLRDYWPTVIKVVIFGVWAVVSTIVSAFSLSYATNNHLVSSSIMLAATIVTAALALVAQPLFGILADRIGRKPVFITGNVICAASIFAYFWSISQGSVPLVFATQIVVMVVGYGMVNPLGPAIVAEMFPTRIRYSGAAVSSQLGLIVTGFAPTIAAAVVRPGPDGWVPVAVFTAICCGISALVTLVWVRETYRVDTHDLGARTGA